MKTTKKIKVTGEELLKLNRMVIIKGDPINDLVMEATLDEDGQAMLEFIRRENNPPVVRRGPTDAVHVPMQVYTEFN